MCGIAGYFSSISSCSDWLSSSVDALNHRGPDDSGIYLDPIFSRTCSYTLVYSGY